MRRVRREDLAMNDDACGRDLDETDEKILAYEVSDDALEAAANMGEKVPTSSIMLIPPNCC
jgi:hypothetical protein